MLLGGRLIYALSFTTTDLFRRRSYEGLRPVLQHRCNIEARFRILIYTRYTRMDRNAKEFLDKVFSGFRKRSIENSLLMYYW